MVLRALCPTSHACISIHLYASIDKCIVFILELKILICALVSSCLGGVLIYTCMYRVNWVSACHCQDPLQLSSSKENHSWLRMHRKEDTVCSWTLMQPRLAGSHREKLRNSSPVLEETAERSQTMNPEA